MISKKPQHRAAVVLATAGLVQTLASAGVISDEMKEHLQRRVTDGGLMGVAIGVVTPDETNFFCFGRASREGAALDPDSIFEIGSISKVFTSMLLAEAVLAGEMRLDDPIAGYLPQSVRVPQRDEKPITLGLLASHRSGLPRMPDNFSPRDERNPYADYHKEDLYAFLSGCTLEAAPGERYAYSNVGAGLLGHVLCLKSGRSYDELIAEKIAGPAGMKHTACRMSAEMKSRLATGHSGGKAVSNWDLDCLEGAGGIRSSARDMTQFLKSCMGEGDGKLARLVEKCVETRYPAGDKMEIGLGWHIDRRYASEVIWHNGGTGGYHSYCGFRADRKLGVVVLSNDSQNTDDIGRHILNSDAPLATIRKAITLEAEKLESYVGHYELRPGVLLKIAREGDGLTAQLTGQEALPIFAEAVDRFFLRAVEAQLTFSRDAAGRVESVTLHQGGRDVTGARLPPERAPKARVEVSVDPKVLAEYAGKYALGPMTFDVRHKEGKLSVQLTGQPRFPVFAESETKFFYKVVDAQLTFVRDEAGKVTALILHQNGMDQRAERVD